MEVQQSSLNKRVVHLIKKYIQPREIYELITGKQVGYAAADQEANTSRDRAMMALCAVSAGRITEIVGGPVFKWDREQHKSVRVPGAKHPGLQRENLVIHPERIMVTEMEVVKRSEKMIKKYGVQVTIRADFAIPLKRSLFENPFWDQLTPYGLLVLEYLERYAPAKGKLFPFEDTRAYEIIREVTGNFPNWFRSQGEHFFGHFLYTDTVKLSKYVNIQDPMQVKHYVGYDWTEQLKDKSISMDFNWIDPAVDEIRRRMKMNYGTASGQELPVPPC